MAKLNQILAIEKGIKSESYAALTEYHKIILKPDLFAGMKKEYQSSNEDGDKLPPESKKVQFIATEMFKTVRGQHSRLLNIIARKDWSNCMAKADVVVDGEVIIKDTPVTYLLFLEKQLTDLHSIVKEMPILDSGDDWKMDDSLGVWKAPEVKTHRTKKVQKPLVLLQPTPEHPGNAVVITEDVVEGYWTTTRFSGAMQRPAKLEMLDRVEKLMQAVKIAREAANNIDEVEPPDVGAALFAYVMPKEG